MASAPHHDPALAHPPGSVPPSQASGSQPAQNLPNLPPHLAVNGLSHEQVMALLKAIPNFNATPSDPKDSVAAETLSNLAQTAYAQQGHPNHPQHIPHQAHYHVVHSQQPPHSHPLASEPGPSSHPRGPPNLGQLGAVASALQPPPPLPPTQTSVMRTQAHDGGEGAQRLEGQDAGAGDGGNGSDGAGDGSDKAGNSGKSSGGRRGGRNAAMSNDEWTRQRKDNHKEVERRRRGNINEGISELGRIVPNGSGEKAKGAILSRAVQYIHHLKENEARNIEKWTLEKLLMDQAMGDLQAQLEEMRRMWEEERIARQRAESELEVLRGIQQGLPMGAAAAAGKPAGQARSKSPDGAKEGGKREREEAAAPEGATAPKGEQSTEGEGSAKRQRVE
ncbi:hypothetical protein AcW1_002333 [Taiwanofungus camphoratus]|nr:hypothetical protein AcV7_003320 [Antrodia cinnamomea]KAI0944678.1 hypothetical protein AcW1_002333 [Antrodia cinnamomea]